SATRAGLARAIGSIQGALPGSVVVRRITCGKPDCACNSDADARHGPYIQWSRSVRGRTVTRILTPEQLDRYRPWFDNARRLKDLVAKLEVASVQAFESSELPRAKPQPPAKPRRRQRPTPSGG
ncbi:MAG: DUF6788 family protein, partial [Mycobacteriales bacterium]